MPDNQDKLRVLYDAVSKDYDLGAYDQFSQKMQDSNKRKAFFDGVGSEYQLGTYDEFENKIGVKKKELSTPPAKPLSSGVATLSLTPTTSQSSESDNGQQISFYNPSSFLGGGIKTDIKDKPTEPQKYVYNEKDNAERLLGFNPNSPRGGDIMNLPNATKFQTQESAAASKIAEQKFAAKEKLDKSAISNEANRRLSKTIQKKYGNNLPLKEEDYQKLEEKELAKLEQDLGNELKKGTLGIVRRTEDNEPFLAPKETFLNAMGNDIANFGENLLSSGYTLYKLTNLQTNPNGILDIANQYNLKQQSQAKIPERSQSIEGDLGTFLGQAATMIPLGMGGAATFGVHSGLTGLNNNLEKLYWEKKKGGADDYTAITESLPAALGDAGIDATVGYFLGKAMPFGTKPTVSQQLAKKTFLQSAQQSLLNANKMGMYMGGGEAAKSVIDNMAGYDRHIKDLPETFFDAASHGFATGLAFEALHTAMKVPTIVKATAKEYLSTLPQEHLFNEIDQSSLPQDAKDKIKTSMQEYNTIKESLKEFVPEKQLGTFTNYQIKANRLVDKNTELETQIKRITAAKNSGGVLEILSKNVDKKIASLNDEIKSNKLQIDNINKALEEYKTKGKEPIELDETSGEETNKIGGVTETPSEEIEAEKPIEPTDESIGTPTTTNTAKEGSVAETKPIENIQPPTEEQILNDLKNKNFATFIYDSEAEVPEQFKDKITSTSEINGKKEVRVTLPKSKADYLLAKGELPQIETTIEQPKESKDINLPKEEQSKDIALQETKTNVEDWSKDVESVDLSKVDWKNPTTEESIAGHESHIENNVKKGQQSLLPKIRELAKKYNLTKEQYLKVLPSIRQVLSNAEPNINSIENIISRESGKNKPTERPKSETTPNVEDIDTKIKEAQSNHDAAKRELDKAIEKVGKTQGEQTSMFDATQKGMFAVDENEAKKILEPLKQKVKETKAELDNLLNRKKIEDEKQQELFDEEKPITKRQTNAEIRSKLKEIDEANTPESLALEYFANGGKVNASELTNEVVGSVGDSRLTKGSNKKRIAAERGGVKEDALVSNTDKNTIKQVAEALYAKANKHLDSDLGFDDNDVRNALIEVLGNHNSWQSVAEEYINKYHPEEVRKNYEKQLEEHYAAYEKAHKNDFENLSIDDINAMLLEEAEQTDNFEEHLNYIKNEQKSSNATNEEPNKRTKSEVNNENESRKGNEKEQGNIANQPINTETNALQVRPTTQEISRPITTGENITKSSGGVRPSEQGETPTQESRTETNIKGEKEIGSIFDEALEKVYNVNENGEFKKADIMAENKFKSKYGEEGKKVIDIVKNFKKYAEQLGIEIKC